MKTFWMLTLVSVMLAIAGGCCGGGSCFANHNPPVTAEELPS